MSVSSISPLYCEGGLNEDLTWEYTAYYRAITTSPNDGPNDIILNASCPQYGDAYTFGNDFNLFAWCRSVNVKLETAKESRLSWIVTANYSSKGAPQDPADKAIQNPADWSWRVSGSFSMQQRAPDKDIDDRALVNAAGEPFLPPPEIEDPQIVLVLEKNTPTIDLSLYADAGGKVNDAAIWGLNARCAKIMQWTFNFAWTAPGQAYVQNRWEVAVKLDGFYFQPLNIGHRAKGDIDPDVGAAKMREATDEFWQPLSRPRLLDQFGDFLADGVNPLFFDQAAGPLQRFKLEDEFDFSQIFPPALPGPFVS